MLFNGIEKDYLTVLRGRQREFFAPISNESKFSSHLIQQEREHRTVVVPVWIKYKNMKELRGISEDMAGWLVTKKPKRLEFKDDPDRFYWAMVEGTINEDMLYNTGTEAEITFTAGYKLSQDRTVEINLDTTQEIGGLTGANWTTETIFSKAQNGYEMQFSEVGMTGLFNINKLKINYSFIEGDHLEIDYSRRLITVNGNDISNALVILESNFMKLPVGDVSFLANHKTEIRYNEAFY